MSRLEGKVAMVTGGARGMGEATVRLMVEQGARVLIGDVLEKEGQALSDELGDAVAFQRLDVTQKSQWDQAVEAAASLGTLNVLVNNAAIVMHKTVMETMKAGGGGSIINISSIDGFQAKNSLAAYASTKWAVRGLTKAAALEMGQYGIRVNSVHPGGIYTAMHGSDFISEEDASKFYSDHALPRVGLPHEVAAVTAFLASDEATYTTGAEFLADGGWNAGLVNRALPQL